MTQQLIQDYNKRYHTNIDAVGMMGAVSSILVAYKDAEMRDEMLKQYLMESYSEMAAQYQYDKMSRRIRGESTEGYKAVPQDLLGEYLVIFNVVVNSVSEQRIEDANQAEIDAKAATERAFQTAEAARIAYNNSLNPDNIERSRNLKAEYNKLEQKYQTAKANEKNVFTFEKYTPTMRNFTLGSHDVQSLMDSQLAGFTYEDFRRHQLATLGVLDPVFTKELPSLDRNVGIEDLEPDDQQNIMETWVTKQLMQEELDSRTWWSKNIWNRREAKAMRDYIEKANTVLRNANPYGEHERFESILNDMLSKGYEKIDDTVGQGMRTFAANFASNNELLRALEEKKIRNAEENRIREERAKEEVANRKAEREQKKLVDEQEREEQKAQWNAKKEAFQPAIDAINAKNKGNFDALEGQSLHQQIQDPKFMPSFNIKTFYDQVNALNEVGKLLKSPNASKVTLNVLMKNSEKLKLMKQFHKLDQKTTEAQTFIDKANEIYEGCQNIQAEQEQIASDPDYVKYESLKELKALTNKNKEEKIKDQQVVNDPNRAKIKIEMNDNNESQELSPVHTEKKEIQPPHKNIP